MTYQEVKPVVWEYSKDGDFIEGVLIKTDAGIGPNESMLYTIENANGFTNVWGATFLDKSMAFVKVGDKLRITYKGLGEKKKGKNPPKLFKVEVDKD